MKNNPETELYAALRPQAFENPAHREALLGELLAARQSRQAAAVANRRSLLRFPHLRPLSWVGVGSLVCFLLIAGWILLAPGQLSYAQVLAALERAKTVHAVEEALRDGKWDVGAEVWYQPGKGIIEQSGEGKTLYRRIDDGATQWRYRGATDTAVKSKSVDPVGEMEELLSLEEFRRCFEQKPTGTRIVAGETCEVYEATDEQAKYRVQVWLEPKTRRIYGWTEASKNVDDTWTEDERGTVTYDVPIDPERFVPEFGPETRIVGGEAALDEQFGLEQVLFKQEFMGLDYAIHTLERSADGLIYIVDSIRASEATVRELGPLISEQGTGAMGYGDRQFLSDWERLADGSERSYQPCELACVMQNGLKITWSVLIPRGSWPPDVQQFSPSIYIHTRLALAQQIEKRGEPSYARFRKITTLDLHPSQQGLKGILARVHEELITLEPLVFQASLVLPDLPNGEKMHSLPYGQPSRVPLKTYEEKMAAYIEHHQLR